jgi:hypothetical protein
MSEAFAVQMKGFGAEIRGSYLRAGFQPLCSDLLIHGASPMLLQSALLALWVLAADTVTLVPH